jgi:protein SCO1/2
MKLVRTNMLKALIFSSCFLIGSSLWAHDEQSVPAPLVANEKARELKDIGITENLGQNLDLNLKFKDENGQDVTLSQYYHGDKPVLLSLVYYGCPGLCSFHLNGVVDSLKNIEWSIGKQFEYVVVSFDTKETSVLAAEKKVSYMKVYNRPTSAMGWHFLTGDAASIQKLTQQVGFKYQWKEETKEWAHASAAVVTTPSGKISRYLHGIIFDERTFRLALTEASEGKVGNFIDRMIWYCFHYDPKLSKYTLYANNLMKVGGVGIILVLVAIMLPFWIRSRREQT